MFLMDLSEMDRLKDILFRAAAQSDEALYILKILRSEMETDVDWKQLDPADTVGEDIQTADASMLLLKESLHDLSTVIAEAAEKCRSGEEEKSAVIAKTPQIGS